MGATETCTIAPNTLTVGDHYNFKLQVKDSATVVEKADLLRLLDGPHQLGADGAGDAEGEPDPDRREPGAHGDGEDPPTPGSDRDTWTWTVSVNGGAYSTATQCATDSGSGSAGATVTCMITGGTLTSGDTYNFELQITDSASAPEVQTSAPSPTVTVA